ncbi:MAG: recombinase RecT [Patescibacteria group bacterium]|nr:recombinase RecT [Patescibacteria group bacterium]
MSNAPLTTIDKAEKPMEFVPFGAADKIKLTVSIIQNSVCIPTKSGKVCSVRDAVRFMMLCQAQRLNPFAGDCFMTGYDSEKKGPQFSMITAHVAFLKRAETCDEYEGMESGIILFDPETSVVTEREGDFKLKTETCVGGWARVYRKGRKPTYRRLSITAMAPRYESDFWSEDKAPGQIVKCAEADALRATFPTLLGGLYNGDELRMNETIASVISADAGVPIFTAAEGPKQIPAETPPKATTPQAELEAIVLEGGYDFNDLQRFLQDSGHVNDPLSLGGFSEIPADKARVLVRAKVGLLAGLAKLKG